MERFNVTEAIFKYRCRHVSKDERGTSVRVVQRTSSKASCKKFSATEIFEISF